MLGIMLGVLLFAGGAFAADANMLQPASDIVYNENVDINGSLDTDSLRVGTPGLGGVTFFNGTVLNEGVDPFTVGDDMRVDGEIYRIQKGGDNPIKISDHMIPTLTNVNNLGTNSNRWGEIWGNDIFSKGFLAKPEASNHMPFTVNLDGTIKFAVYGSGHIYSGSSLHIGNYDGSGGVRLSNDGDIDTEGTILDSNGLAVEFGDPIQVQKRTSQPYTCDTAHLGSIYYDASDGYFKGCVSRPSALNQWQKL